MRNGLRLVALTIALLGGAAVAAADTMGGGADEPVPMGAGSGVITETADQPIMVKGRTGAPAMLPPPGEPPHEYLEYRPSGFWTSNSPAIGGSYRWRLLGIGVVLASLTGFGMLRLIRRADRERAARP